MLEAARTAAGGLGSCPPTRRKKSEEKSPWKLLVDYNLFWEYLQTSTLPATPLTYVKDLVCVCLYARERWSRDPELPTTEEFKVFRQDKLGVFNKQADAARNAPLTTGKVCFASSLCPNELAVPICSAH